MVLFIWMKIWQKNTDRKLWLKTMIIWQRKKKKKKKIKLPDFSHTSGFMAILLLKLFSTFADIFQSLHFSFYYLSSATHLHDDFLLMKKLEVKMSCLMKTSKLNWVSRGKKVDSSPSISSPFFNSGDVYECPHAPVTSSRRGNYRIISLLL